jgi:hypothetical protein
MYLPFALKATEPSTEVWTVIEMSIPLLAMRPPLESAGALIVEGVMTPVNPSLHDPPQLVDNGVYLQIL